jgi:hypothetical protein
MAFLAIGSAKELARVPMGPYVGVLLGEVQSVGLIQYGHVLAVIDPQTGSRVFAMAAEKNAFAGTSIGGGSYFLCGYDGASHLNYGASDDYAERDKFLAKALERARQHLNLPTDAHDPVKNGDVHDPFGERGFQTSPRSPGPSQPAAAPGSRRAAGPAAFADQDLRAAMWLSFAGAALVAARLLFLALPVSHGFPPAFGILFTLLSLAGYTLFAVGCWTAGESIPGQTTVWARLAALAAGAAAFMTVVLTLSSFAPEVWFMVGRISPRGFFMVGLGFHALFLIELALLRGLRIGVRPAFSLLMMWGLLTLAEFAVTWNHHHSAEWVTLCTLLGLGLWTIFHLALIRKLR